VKIWKKKLINSVISYTPFSDQMLRLLSPRDRCDTLLILTYHMVDSKNPYLPDWCCLPTGQFARQMEYLKKYFQVIPLQGCLKILNQQKSRKKPLAAITFDDGYYNNFSQAFPILNRLNLPATIFLTTGFIDSSDTLWFCKLNKALHRTEQSTLNWKDNVYDISTPLRKSKVYIELQQKLKKLPHQQLNNELSLILSSLGDTPSYPVEKSSLFRMLDSESISRMQDSGIIEFGAHTKDHVILSRETKEEQRIQIHDSINHVRALTGEKDIPFAFPNGSPADYNAVSVNEVANAGVSCCVTMVHGLNRPDIQPLEMKRIGVGGDWQVGLFRCAVQTGFPANI